MLALASYLNIVQMIVLDKWRPDRTYESFAFQREQINRAREQAWKNTLSVGLSPEVIIITVEPRLTTTPFIRPPRYYGHILSNQT